jgi:SAM-dependent methyltransferase
MATDPSSHEAAVFVDAYLNARQREGRLLPDDVVRSLPHLPSSTSDDLRARYLSAVRGPVRVWDLGCGNGWLAARVASLEHVCAIGVDVNTAELEQAQRVFADRPRLRFRAGDLCDAPRFVADRAGHPSSESLLDVVLLASTLQYVSDASGLLHGVFDAISPRGEIHVLDTPIYRRDQVASARERTMAHYEQLGVSEMAEHYHHHKWSIFSGLPYDVRYRPDARVRQIERRILGRAISPFPWIRITSRAKP